MTVRNAGARLGLAVGLAGVGGLAVAVLPFPGTGSGTEIGGGLASGFEPSGAAWNPVTGKLFLCGDNGAIARMNPDGTATTTWSLTGNWEGITLANQATAIVFVVDEDTAVVREFDAATGTAGRSFSLTTATAAAGVTPLAAGDLDALLDGGDGTGAEALAFVPVAGAPEGGEFHVGSQENGTIYRFRLSLSSGTTVTYLGKFKTWTASHNDLSGLEYDPSSGLLVAVWDSQNVIRALTPAGQIVAEWEVPAGSNDEEGIVLAGPWVFIAEDPAPASEVWRYPVAFGVGARWWVQ